MSTVLAHGEVTRVVFDYGFELLLGEDVSVRVGSSASVTLPPNDEPVSAVVAATTLVGLVGKTVQLTASDEGELVATVGGEVAFEVPPLTDFEAWVFSASSGRLVVCMPGGELARWSDADR